MNQLTITTTQNVAISFDNASIGDRILAFVIDMVIKILYVIAIVFLLELFRGDRLLRGMDNWSQVAMYLLIFSPVVFYTLFFEIFMQGRTPGKLVTKIKVIKIDGYQAQVGDYLIRWVFRLIDLLLSSGVIGILAIILTDKNQRLGDMVAGTAVISTKQKITFSQTIFQELPVEYIPTYPQVIALSDEDIRIIKEALRNVRLNNDKILLEQLTQKVERVIGVANKSETQLKFIDTVLADYNHFTSMM
ncbi:RDD family protein [Flavobacterium sp. NKUCC04_CG]|uniref:RDD family protein n=1 Tax=Flavobacterium sp. NKUCC04_CG TaxID=2842121 RepID=UPI001C5A8234|nr:RDD family protein [Flavobacterium sp. NKUCC04_CG]MBW3517987.1 RDD family protein [Flavobacterium sp. NKUCC04_CG]